MTQTDRQFGCQDVPKISEIICILETVSSDSSLIPLILRTYVLFVCQMEPAACDFSLICET